MIRPVDVPDLRLRFIREWGPYGWFTSHLGSWPEMDQIPTANILNTTKYRQESLRRADLIWVSAAFNPLLVAAADAVPADLLHEQIEKNLACERALVIFEAPPYIPWDQWDDEAPLSAGISWETAMVDGGPGLCVAIYRQDSNSDAGGWWNVGEATWIKGRSVGSRRSWKLIVALSALMQQPAITDIDHEPLPRSMARRCERTGVPTGVRVVRLRRATGSHIGHGDHLDWSHRWIVSGHWRNQAVGVDRADRRLTWIAPHIKGPDDKPLVMRETVKALVR